MLSDTIEALIAVFARDSPGFHDDLVLVDSTPIECARSIETTRRSQLADAAGYGYCASHSRYFWGPIVDECCAQACRPVRARWRDQRRPLRRLPDGAARPVGA